MVFSSAVFLFAFLPLTLIAYYLLDRRFRNVFLLIMSLVFYGWGGPRYLLLLGLSIAVNYALALWVAGEKRAVPGIAKAGRFPVVLAVIFNLAVFFVFKYLNFTVANANALLLRLGLGESLLKQTAIVLPIGISFFTFQAMSYVFDVYRGRGEVQRNPLNVGLYIAFFPQLIAGPIVRYQTVAEEIRTRRESLRDFSSGLERFILGLAKKVILANTAASLADQAFDAAGPIPALLAWLGALAYTLQIYFDFSGYSDMAIGLGRMFGFHFDENFDYPYASATVTEFWRRWHISLGSWFRDYVYFPLGGSRVSRGKLVRNLLAVWLLTGVWHGANWTFILWGLLYFLLLTAEKLLDLPKKLPGKPAAAAVYRVFTLLCVVLGWVLFRAENLGGAAAYLRSMLGLGGAGLADGQSLYLLRQYWRVLLLGALLSLPLLRSLLAALRKKLPGEAVWDALKKLALLALAALAVAFTVSNSFNPFIYFNF
ncbi:MAG: MBOAT family protein [Oscillospiraceae bacterium]|nr:MBOAT family protein [Oscillospiraceae bacterium]